MGESSLEGLISTVRQYVLLSTVQLGENEMEGMIISGSPSIGYGSGYGYGYGSGNGSGYGYG